jgi:MYXO-CTERM domain-containing protein
MLLSVAIGLVGRSAAAADGGASELSTLEAQLSSEQSNLATLLSSADCVSACKALGSIQRAAEKICTLEPGPRCDAAKSKADDATRRVREACPDCAFALRGQPTPSPPEPTAEKSRPASAPPSEESKRGCASCATASGPDLGDFAAIFGVVAMVELLRRRARRRV